MAQIWVRTGNDGADPAVAIDDLGIIVPTGASWTKLSAGSASDPDDDGYGQFTARELRDSVDLYDLITGGSLEFSTDGATESTLTWVADLPLMEDFTDDHFNLTSGRLTLPNDTNPPGTIGDPQPGDLFYDTDDGYLVFYSGVTAQWVTITDSGSVTTDHGTLTGLLDDDHTQYVLLTGDRARNNLTGALDISDGYLTLPRYTDPATQVDSPEAGDVAYDSDDGYIVYYNGATWVNLLDGATAIDHGSLGGLLDDDHTQYGLLAGNAARNAVTGTYDFGDGYFIAPTYPSAPTENVVDGEIFVDDGVMYVYDASRSKWLSVTRQTIVAGKRNNARDVYLRISDNIASSQTGLRALRDGTIVGITVDSDDTETWTAEVHVNDTLIPGASLAITASDGAISSTINADFSAGDNLQVYANTPNGRVRSPIVYVEIAWRA